MLDTAINTSYVQNFAEQVFYKANKAGVNNYLKLDGSSTMTGNSQMNNSRIKGLPTTTPQSGGEATSKD